MSDFMLGLTIILCVLFVPMQIYVLLLTLWSIGNCKQQAGGSIYDKPNKQREPEITETGYARRVHRKQIRMNRRKTKLTD